MSLPADLFERGERQRSRRGMNRSEFVASLYRRHLAEFEEAERVERYRAAYEEKPETPAERWLVEQSVAALMGDAPR